MTSKNRTIGMSQDVYDRFIKSFYPIGSSNHIVHEDAKISRVVVENGPLDVIVIAGSGNIKITGEVTEKELIQIASFFKGNDDD